MTSLSKKEYLVLSILNDPAPVRAVAVAHNVSEGTVRNIKMLKTRIARRVHLWAYENDYVSYLLEPQKRFTKRQVAAIRNSTETSDKLAKKHRCAPSTIRMIRTGKTYADLA